MTTSEGTSGAGFGSVSTLRKIGGGVAVVIGIALLILTFTNNLFEVGPAFEEMIDDFRPVLTDESLATVQADIDGLAAAGEEFQTAVAPAMGQALGIDPVEFGAMVQENYPDVAAGMAALPEITATFTGLIQTLDSQQDLFASADAIPSDDLPATTVPWIIVITGIGAIASGVLLFMPGRLWPVLTAVFGLVVLVSVFALSLPQKAADADELNENLKPIYTQELIDGATQSLAVVSAMGQEMQTEMLPDLAMQLDMSPEELNVFMGENFPATAQAMQTMPDALERFEAFVGVFAANLDNYMTIQPVSFTPIIWWIVVAGALLVLIGGVLVILKD
jgi:hypothetical protein